MSVVKTCDIQREVTNMECTVTRLKNRIRGLDDLLDMPGLSGEERRNIKETISQVESLLHENNAALKSIHKHKNHHIMYLAAFIFFSFFMFGIYCMFYRKI